MAPMLGLFDRLRQPDHAKSVIKTQQARQVRLRPAGAEDHAKLAAMLAGLSSDSRYRRFVGGAGVPHAGLLKTLVRAGDDGAAWLAVAGDEVVAHAGWAIEPGAPDRVAELAVVTTDAWQGRGLGTRLLAVVAADAARAGATALRLYVLADNRRLVARIGREWPDTKPRRDGTLLVYTVPAVSRHAVSAAPGSRRPAGPASPRRPVLDAVPG